jgi:hypothetical protein
MIGSICIGTRAPNGDETLPWTYKAPLDIHEALEAASLAAVREIPGAADRTHCVIAVAVRGSSFFVSLAFGLS